MAAILILLLSLFMLHFCYAETDTLSTNQFISDAHGTTLVSNGGVFALGFFSPLHSKKRYVGIWYHNKPSQRVVWVANRETPIENTTGALGIRDGNLVIILRGTEHGHIWSTNLSTPVRKSHLKISDSGNLVLFHGNYKVWESFDHPTHVWLPGMKYGVDKRTGLSRALVSWKSPDDPAAGDFVLELGLTGLPQFHTIDTVQQKTYLRIGPWNGQGLSGVPEIPNSPYFNFTFVNNQNEIYLVYNPYNTSVLHHFMLDPFGLFQRLTWYERAQQWERGWSVPRDRCDVYAQCGSFGECGFDDELACNCLPGFEPKSPQDWVLRDGSDGCVRKISMCGDGDGDGFLKMEHVKLPDTSAAEAILGLGLKECEDICERNCSCSAYAVADINRLGTGCVVWYGDLMDMRRYSDGGDDVYVRVDAAELTGNKLILSEANHRSYTKVEAIGMSSITLVVVVGVMYYCSLLMKKKKNNRVKGQKGRDRLSQLLVLDGCFNASHFGEEVEEVKLPLFDLDTVNAATDNFSSTNKLGEGGFGEVYKGQLCGGKGIAVKKLSANSNQGIEEFKNEVILMAKLQHRNLVRLLGCCIEGQEKMLVYEYMFNKSLDFFIFGMSLDNGRKVLQDETKRKLLDWRKRINIIIGIARGILYLHEDSRLKIIHRDLKASNVLLDVEMNPKISDFGVARIFGGNQTHAKTKKVVGTYGYMSPEYAMNGSFSIKSDVFSFGVLLLEIISGTRNKGYYYEDPSSNVVGRAWELWGQGKALELVDSSMVEGSYPVDDVLRCVHVGLLCVQGRAADRPTMRSVVFMLENVTPLPRPKLPAYISPAHSATSTCVHDRTVTTIIPR